MEKIEINFLEFEIVYVLDGLKLLKQNQPIRELQEYIIKQSCKISPKINFKYKINGK